MLNKKRVLVSGSAGFIGAHVVPYLLDNTDWEVVCLDRYDTSGNINRLASILTVEQMKRVKIVYQDLKAPINNHTSLLLGAVDNIVHLAASSHVDRSIEDPLSFIQDNVVGTTNLLIWAEKEGMLYDNIDSEPGKKKKVYRGKFINFSTDEVFGPAELGYAHKENDPHRPSNPYSASKSGQESIGYSFFITYGLPVITTHTMNNFGSMQHPEKLIPKTIRSVINQTPMPIFAKLSDSGKMEAVGSRFWLNAKNTASAILFLLTNGVSGEQYNIIGFDELTNLDIAEKVAKIIGKHLIVDFVNVYAQRPGHDIRYALDGSKMRDMGWEPVVDFDTSLKETVEWTLSHPEWQ